MVGGLWEAVALAKQAAGIPKEDKVTVVEVSRASTSPLALLSGGASVSAFGGGMAGLGGALALAAAAALVRGAVPGGALAAAAGAGAAQQLALAAAAAAAPFGLDAAALTSLLSGLSSGQVLALDLDAAVLSSGRAGGVIGGAAAAPGGGGSSVFEEEGGAGAALAAADEWVSRTVDEWLL